MGNPRGSGKTKRFFPFHMNPAIGRKHAKAHRIKRKGLALPADKAALRAIGEQANATHKRR